MESPRDQEPVHRRISKACDNCVKRKSKCDGESPCGLCSQRGIPCHYRVRNRVRPSAAQRRAQKDQKSGAGGPERKLAATLSLNGSPHTTVPESDQSIQGNELQSGIAASQSLSQLYYGPSSNFAFLQHVHKAFTRPSESPEDRQRNQQEGTFDRFKNRDLFFGLNEVFRPSRSNRLWASTLMFLPQALARVFFEKFVASHHHLMPHLSLNELESLLSRLYGSDTGSALDPGETAMILLVLANGASLTNYEGWTEDLYKRAKREVPELDEVVNIKAIHINLLLANYYASCGRANAGYMQLGIACRKAYASGMHRDVDYESPTENRQQRSEIRKLTFWSLVLMERWVSFWLGRPSAVVGESITIGLPESSPLIRAFANLSNIIAQALRLMYDEGKISQPVRLWEAAQHIRHDLYVFQSRAESEMGFPLDGSVADPFNIDQLFLMHFFLHVWMTTFRPFLIIYLTWKRNNPSSSSGDGSTDSKRLPVDMWWLPEACQIAVENAKKMIYFFSAAAQKSEVAKGLNFTSVYIESACCLLFHDSMRDRTAIDENVVAIKEAMDCLSTLVQTGPVPAITQTLSQLMSELETVKTLETTPNYASSNALRRLPSAFAASDPMRMGGLQGANVDLGQTAIPPDFAQQPGAGALSLNTPDLDWESIWSSMGTDPNMFSSMFAPDLGEFFNPPPPPPGQ